MSLLFLLCLEIGSVDGKLVFVHTLFRHGDRTPEKHNLYPASPYYNESHFKPFGFGQLTNKGKLTTYRVGQALRKRYYDFLDDSYNINLIDARSTDSNRTKASLQAMLAGLFPVTEELVWLEGMNWQPIATTYQEKQYDKELICFGCPAWKQSYNSFLYSSEGSTLMKNYKDIFKLLTQKTGTEFTKLVDVYRLYNGFTILESLEKPLPEWSENVYPDDMKEILAIHYYFMTATPVLRQMITGYLLKKILQDTDDKIGGRFPEKQMSILCGHEFNIASLLRVLDICEDYNSIPPYGSYFLFELHHIDDYYGFKIFFHDYKSAEPKLMKLPECKEFCSLENFKRIVKRNIPVSDDLCKFGKELSERSRSSSGGRIQSIFVTSIISFAAILSGSRIH